MTKFANLVLGIRYIFYIVIFSLSAVVVALTLKIIQMTYELFLNIFKSEYKKLIHEALEIADVSLVIVLMGALSNYLLFTWIITEDNIDLMPKWAVKQSQEHDAYGLKSSIAITIAAIFLIFVLGEIIDPKLSSGAQAGVGGGTEWSQLALYALLIVSVLILSISAWISRKH